MWSSPERDADLSEPTIFSGQSALDAAAAEQECWGAFQCGAEYRLEMGLCLPTLQAEPQRGSRRRLQGAKICNNPVRRNQRDHTLSSYFDPTLQPEHQVGGCFHILSTAFL